MGEGWPSAPATVRTFGLEKVATGDWTRPLRIAGAGLATGLGAALVFAVLLTSDHLSVGVVLSLAATLLAAAFGADVVVDPGAGRRDVFGDGGLFDDRGIFSDDISIKLVPLTLTAVVLVVFALAFLRSARGLALRAAVVTAVQSVLLLSGGVLVVSLLGRIAETPLRPGAPDGRLNAGLTYVLRQGGGSVHGSVAGSLLGPLVWGALALALALVWRRADLSARVVAVRGALGPSLRGAAVLTVGALVITVVAYVVALVVSGDAPTTAGAASVVLVLPNVALGVLGLSLGTGLEGRTDALGGQRVGLHLTDVAGSHGLVWLLPPAALLLLVFVGLVVAARYDSPGAARRAALTAAGVTFVGVVALGALAGLGMRFRTVHSSVGVNPGLTGLWLAVLVGGATMLATVVIPRLPARVLRVLARVAGRGPGVLDAPAVADGPAVAEGPAQPDGPAVAEGPDAPEAPSA